MPEPTPLVLASASRTRWDMLAAAGLSFEVDPAAVDEPALRDAMSAGKAGAGEIAMALACAKASNVGVRRARALVIGADQVLVLGSRLFEKPGNLAEARAQLLELRGKTHELCSAVALATADRIVWSCLARARMTMRSFTSEFLDDYLARSGDQVTRSVGAYQLEGLGLQLFDAIDGDTFTILGLPLLPLLGELRARGVIAS